MKLKERIIKTLGGRTEEEYQAEKRDKEIQTEVNQAVKSFLRVTRIDITANGKVLRAKAVVNTQLHPLPMPVKEVKRQLAQYMVDELMSASVIAYDIEDIGGNMHVSATLHVLVPDGFVNKVRGD